MKTDSLFYRLFQREPALVLELAELTISPAGYRFRSEEIKQTAFRLDGVMVPDGDDDRPHLFIEVQFQPDGGFYTRLFSEILLYLRQHPDVQAWHAIMIHPDRGTEGDPAPAVHSLLQLPELSRVYLEDWRHRQDVTPAALLVQLIICPEAQALDQARRLLEQPRPAGLSESDWLEFIETILVYKLPRLGREELRKMLGFKDIDLKRTKFYQEVFAEGHQEGRQEGHREGRRDGRREGEAAVLLLLIEHKFGSPDEAVRERIENADAETLLRWSARVLTAETVEEVLAS